MVEELFGDLQVNDSQRISAQLQFNSNSLQLDSNSYSNWRVPAGAYSCSFDCLFLLFRLLFPAYSGQGLANSRPIQANSGAFFLAPYGRFRQLSQRLARPIVGQFRLIQQAAGYLFLLFRLRTGSRTLCPARMGDIRTDWPIRDTHNAPTPPLRSLHVHVHIISFFNYIRV